MHGNEGVTVTGSATVETVPDTVLAALGVDVRSDDLSTALRAAEESLARVRDGLVEGGVARTDMRSTRSSIWREDRTDEGGKTSTVVHVRLGLQVTLRDVAAAGGLVHEALAAAGPDATMDSLDFAVSDPADAQARARDAAFDDALAIATAYAARAGRALGRVTSIVEGVPQGPAPRMARMVAASMADAVPLEPGQTSVGAAVTVAWAFAD